MTTREFIQHLILNCELNDKVTIEVNLPDNIKPGFYRMVPTHAHGIGGCFGDPSETIIECKGEED